MSTVTVTRTVVLIGLLILPVASAGPAEASGVVGTGNPKTCTEAALDAKLAGGGSVTFNCGAKPFSIILKAAKVISADTSLDGGGLLRLSGGRKVGIFLVTAGATLSLSHTTLSRGRFSFGGAIYIDPGSTVLVESCTFSRNRAPGPGDGGAIDNYGTLRVSNSTFLRNRTDGVSGAIENNGHMTVSNSTFARNHASVGGAIASAGPLTITNSTFFRNGTFFYGSGGAIYSTGHTTVQNTILAYSGRGTHCVGPVIDGGHNLRWPPSDTSCFGTVGDPKFAYVLDARDLLETMALRPGSAAIDAGDNALCAAPPVNNLDQRGFVRPGVGASNCSIGAYEFNASPPSP